MLQVGRLGKVSTEERPTPPARTRPVGAWEPGGGGVMPGDLLELGTWSGLERVHVTRRLQQ